MNTRGAFLHYYCKDKHAHSYSDGDTHLWQGALKFRTQPCLVPWQDLKFQGPLGSSSRYSCGGQSLQGGHREIGAEPEDRWQEDMALFSRPALWVHGSGRKLYKPQGLQAIGKWTILVTFVLVSKSKGLMGCGSPALFTGFAPMLGRQRRWWDAFTSSRSHGFGILTEGHSHKRAAREPFL